MRSASQHKSNIMPSLWCYFEKKDKYLYLDCGYYIYFFLFGLFASYYDRESNPNKSRLKNIIDNYFADKSRDEVSSSSTLSANYYTFNGYSLNDRERTVLKAMFVMDFDSLLNGHNANLSSIWQRHLNVISVTSDELQCDYENNEVAGDQKYRGKTLLVTGIIMSINRGIGENHYVCLNGGRNMFIQPHAHMYEGHENYLANLQKGQAITLVCKGDGMLMGSAVLSGCAPTRNLAEALIDINIATGKITDQFSKGHVTLQMFVASSLVIASSLQNSSSCYETDFGKDVNKYNKCTAEINKILIDKEKMNKSSFKLATDKLKLDFKKYE